MASGTLTVDPSFFSKVRQNALSAIEAPFARSIKIDGFEIELLFASSRFCERMMEAMLHLECVPTKPALQIFVWDTAHTKTVFVPPPWTENSYLPRGDIANFETEGYSLAFQLSSGCLSILDELKNEAFFWTLDFEKLPYWEVAAPFRMILQWWLRTVGFTLVHAASVAMDAGALLLPGKGGIGKSTTAIRAWELGMSYIADDYCLISSNHTPMVHTLYRSLKIRRDRAHELNLKETVFGTEKAVYFLEERLLLSSLLKGIVIPKIVQRKEARLVSATKMDAIKALAPSTIYQLAGADETALKGIVSVIKQLPCYFLEVGSDPENSLRCLKEVIHQ